MTNNAVDHVCVADHCIACCPTARGYSDGYEAAKLFYSTKSVDDKTRVVMIALILIVAVTVLTFIIVHKVRSGNERG